MDVESGKYVEIEGDTKFIIHINGSLGIFDVKKVDEGTYKIELSNRGGITTSEVEVEIAQQKGQFPGRLCITISLPYQYRDS